MKSLLIEGWRGVNHSFALVNQNQILSLARMEKVKLFHRDLPFPFERWNRTDNGDGFAARERQVIDALAAPDPALDKVDAIYRICSPFRAGGRSDARTVTFMAVEFVLGGEQFASEGDRLALLASDSPIVTPSAWSRERILEHGFRPDRVRIVPHGVDAERFRPLGPEERHSIRAQFGIGDDETLFVNVGAPYWYKGTDLLLKAFATLRLEGLKVRLLVKDQRALYGRTLEGVIDVLGRGDSRLLDERVMAGVTAIADNLSPERISALLGIADCYVSPYRAEGFNLPALEAIACGVPVIVTAGGATDDFCDDATAIRLCGRLERSRDQAGAPTTIVEPDFGALVEAMLSVARGARPEPVRFAASRQAVLERFAWGRIADSLVRIALDENS